MGRYLLSHGHLIVDGNREYIDGALLINDETIEDVFYHTNQIKQDLGEYIEIDLKGKIVMPGFFDSHLHGCFGYDFNEISLDKLNEVSKALRRKGTTSFLTTLTNNEHLLSQLKTLDDKKVEGHLGIHLEGPFINPEYKGAINERYIIPYDEKYLNEILDSSSKILQMTLAPEIKDAEKLMKQLRNNNIKIMLGHSGALKDDIKEDYDGFSHLFNASNGLHHRNIGLVNLAFDDNDKYVEVIADGIHLDTSILKLIYRNIRKDRVILISDCTLMAGLNDGEYEFEGTKCLKKDLLCVNEEGKISGGASFIIDGLKNMHKAGASLTDLLLMSSLNAYRFYGLDNRYGSLDKGKYADIVILDDDLNLISVYVRGEMINA